MSFPVALAFVLLFLAWLLAIADAWLSRRLFSHSRNDATFWRQREETSKRAVINALNQRDAAMKQIAALRGQSPGRDNSGRFVKKPKSCDSHGSE